jgi:hypothetical protein
MKSPTGNAGQMPYNVAVMTATVACNEWIVDVANVVPADASLNGQATAATHLASYLERGKGAAVKLLELALAVFDFFKTNSITIVGAHNISVEQAALKYLCGVIVVYGTEPDAEQACAFLASAKWVCTMSRAKAIIKKAMKAMSVRVKANVTTLATLIAAYCKAQKKSMYIGGELFDIGAFVAHDCDHDTRAGAFILENLDSLLKILADLVEDDIPLELLTTSTQSHAYGARIALLREKIARLSEEGASLVDPAIAKAEETILRLQGHLETNNEAAKARYARLKHEHPGLHRAKLDALASMYENGGLKEKIREYQGENRVKIAVQRKEYRQDNRVQIAEQKKDWYEHGGGKEKAKDGYEHGGGKEKAKDGYEYGGVKEKAKDGYEYGGVKEKMKKKAKESHQEMRTSTTAGKDVFDAYAYIKMNPSQKVPKFPVLLSAKHCGGKRIVVSVIGVQEYANMHFSAAVADALLQLCASTFEDLPPFEPNNVIIQASKFPRGEIEALISRAEAEAAAKWTGAKGVKAQIMNNRADQLKKVQERAKQVTDDDVQERPKKRMSGERMADGACHPDKMDLRLALEQRKRKHDEAFQSGGGR